MLTLLLFVFVYIYSGTNYTIQSDVGLSVNCSFGNEICDYDVSNTSTHFKLYYVFGISSLGEFIYAIFSAEPEA